MADYTDLPDTAVGVGGTPSGTTVTALRDNPIAIAEGAVGAPRIVLDALGTDAVLQATARDATAGAVGTYAFLGTASDVGTNLYGTTRAGSQLFPAGIRSGGDGFNTDFPVVGVFTGQNSARAGTWRCMGVNRAATPRAAATLWLRIS